MIYSDKVKKAMLLMASAHNGQFDKGGYPYAAHPLHVAESMVDESSTVVALLHDVVEDCPSYSLDGVAKEVGLSEEEKEALRLLTHDENVPYEDYVLALSNNRIARKVKLSDMRHNLDTTRMKERHPKYETLKKCYAFLLEIDNKEGNA